MDRPPLVMACLRKSEMVARSFFLPTIQLPVGLLNIFAGLGGGNAKLRHAPVREVVPARASRRLSARVLSARKRPSGALCLIVIEQHIGIGLGRRELVLLEALAATGRPEHIIEAVLEDFLFLASQSQL